MRQILYILLILIIASCNNNPTPTTTDIVEPEVPYKSKDVDYIFVNTLAAALSNENFGDEFLNLMDGEVSIISTLDSSSGFVYPFKVVNYFNGMLKEFKDGTFNIYFKKSDSFDVYTLELNHIDERLLRFIFIVKDKTIIEIYIP